MKTVIQDLSDQQNYALYHNKVGKDSYNYWGSTSNIIKRKIYTLIGRNTTIA